MTVNADCLFSIWRKEIIIRRFRLTIVIQIISKSQKTISHYEETFRRLHTRLKSSGGGRMIGWENRWLQVDDRRRMIKL